MGAFGGVVRNTVSVNSKSRRSRLRPLGSEVKMVFGFILQRVSFRLTVLNGTENKGTMSLFSVPFKMVLLLGLV